jgi:glycosyltransferase involved in cell wall biosynthesis
MILMKRAAVILCYNNETIFEVVKNLLKQTRKLDKIIIVDNNSKNALKVT